MIVMQKSNTVFTEIFVVLISDVTFITKFKKLNNWRCTAQHAGLPRLIALQHKHCSFYKEKLKPFTID